MAEKKKREKSEDFIGETFNEGKLRVVGIHSKEPYKAVKFKVTCTKCSKDSELFPLGHFISTKSDLLRGRIPCGCSKKPEWCEWQYLILARRAGEKKGFIVHGFSEEFKNQNTKLNLECLKDGHKWSASVNNVINKGSGCPECADTKSAEQKKTPEQDALQKCIDICKEMNYGVIGFVGKYKNAHKTYFEYICNIHGKQYIRYHDFVNGKRRCGGCARDGSGFYGYYSDRKDERDYLYILNFDNKFIKVGRSFDVDQRIKNLRTESKIKKIYKLRIFTATHQEIYDLEQELHSELRNRNFQHYVAWSTECFENDCQFILNKLLDSCGLEEVSI